MSGSSTPRCNARSYAWRVGGRDQDWLTKHREVALSGAVDIGLAHETRIAAGDAADEKRRDVRLLPNGEVVTKHDRDLRVELHVRQRSRLPSRVRRRRDPRRDTHPALVRSCSSALLHSCADDYAGLSRARARPWRLVAVPVAAASRRRIARRHVRRGRLRALLDLRPRQTEYVPLGAELVQVLTVRLAA